MITTNAQILALKPKDKPYRKGCGDGLNILVHPNGQKYWIFRYRVLGRENNRALGVYPQKSFLEAKNEVMYLKLKMHSIKRGFGLDLLSGEMKEDPDFFRNPNPRVQMHPKKPIFKDVALQMMQSHFVGKSDGYQKKSLRYLELYVFPWMGKFAIDEIKAANILDCLQRIQRQNKGNTIKKVAILINLTMKHALLREYVLTNPYDAIKGSISIPKTKHMPAFTEEEDVRGLLRAIHEFKGSFVVNVALNLAPLVFVRPFELRTAKWKDFNLETAEWRFLVTKTQTEHLVPLSTQAIHLLEELRPLTGQMEYLFPNAHDPKKPMSEAAINAALKRLGFNTKTEMTGHGFRAMARTLLHEKLGYSPDVIEHQLAHQVPDSLGQAYNRTRFIDVRKKMMQDYANYLENLAKK